jgi:hypothetical protein
MLFAGERRTAGPRSFPPAAQTAAGKGWRSRALLLHYGLGWYSPGGPNRLVPGRGEEKLMLDVFYGAFSPACFGLLGLWLVVVQIRMHEWQGSAIHRRRAYGVALHFALPGIMSLLALVNAQDPAFWRVSFAIVALGGAVVMATVRSSPGRGERGSSGLGAAPAADQLGMAAYVAAIVLYVLIGALAFAGGVTVLRIEAILLTALIFLGFNVAWLLLFDDKQPSRVQPPAATP